MGSHRDQSPPQATNGLVRDPEVRNTEVESHQKAPRPSWTPSGNNDISVREGMHEEAQERTQDCTEAWTSWFLTDWSS